MRNWTDEEKRNIALGYRYDFLCDSPEIPLSVTNRKAMELFYRHGLARLDPRWCVEEHYFIREYVVDWEAVFEKFHSGELYENERSKVGARTIRNWLESIFPDRSYFVQGCEVVVPRKKDRRIHTNTGNEIRESQLGMSHGRAANILRKNIMFALLVRLGENFCYRCGREIVSPESLSIEHITPWMYSENPKELFFDVSNISFSHASCNSRAARHGDFDKEKHSEGMKRYWVRNEAKISTRNKSNQ